MFTWTNVALVVATVLVGAFLFQPRMLKSETWQATVTPLASIIGSGFLVAGPLLAGIAGHFAALAMLALCGAGYLFGSAIRHNIVHIEPELEQGASRFVRVVAMGHLWRASASTSRRWTPRPRRSGLTGLQRSS